MGQIPRKNHLYTFNKFICVLICIWFAWPYANYTLGMNFGVGLTFLWLATSGRFIFMKKWSIDLILVVVFFITITPYVFTGNFRYSSFNTVSILGTFYLFFLGMFLFHYYAFYRQDYVFLGKIAFVTIVFYVVGSIQTYIGLSIYPAASRYLAVGGLNPEARSVYYSMGIGGFNFVYSSVFLLIMTVHTLIKQRTKISSSSALLLLLSAIFIAAMIVRSSYAIALLMSILGCVLVFTKNQRLFYGLLILSIVLLLMTPPESISKVFLGLADLFSNKPTLNEKLVDVAQTLNNGYGSQSQTMYRIELYATSLKTFFEQPLFGINGPLGDGNGVIGGHSGWFDMMAYFGLFTIIPMFLSIVFNFNKMLRLSKGNHSFAAVYIVQVLFLVYGIINPVLYIYQIGLIVFFIVPAIPYINQYLNRRHFGMVAVRDR